MSTANRRQGIRRFVACPEDALALVGLADRVDLQRRARCRNELGEFVVRSGLGRRVEDAVKDAVELAR